MKREVLNYFVKKVAIVAISLVMSVGAIAQQRGDFAVGANALVGIGLRDGDYYFDGGFGAALLFNISDPIRLAGEFDMLWGFNA